jgi:dTDP-4-dehydrorhamnose 3,5-epimerase-like enzyme
MQARKEPIKISIDDRGVLLQLFDIKNNKITFDGQGYIDLPPVKRIYLVRNFSRDIIRGMHYHEYEWKYFIVIKGSAKFIISHTPNISEETKTFVLSEAKPEVLIVPPHNYNGWISLEENTLLLGMSNFSLEESLKDDKRIPPDNFLELFKVKSR